MRQRSWTRVLPLVVAVILITCWVAVSAAVERLVPSVYLQPQDAIDDSNPGDVVNITDVDTYDPFVVDVAVEVKSTAPTEVTIDAGRTGAAWAVRITDSGGYVHGLTLVSDDNGTGIADVGPGRLADCTLKDDGNEFGNDGAAQVSTGRIEDCEFTLTSGQGRGIYGGSSGSN